MRSSWDFWMGREGEETGKRQEAKGRGDGLYNQYSAVYNSEHKYPPQLGLPIVCLSFSIINLCSPILNASLPSNIGPGARGA